jgi:uncharacterized protein YuzE
MNPRGRAGSCSDWGKKCRRYKIIELRLWKVMKVTYRELKVTYDASVDAAYVYLAEADSSRFGFTYVCDPSQVGGQIHLDVDFEGRLIGIEVLQASAKLPSDLIDLQTPRRPNPESGENKG